MPLNVPTTPATIPIGYTYALDADLDVRWGKKNVDKWADADNDKDAGKILTRRAWALARAERYINMRLKGYIYTIPFAALPDTPQDVSDLVVTYAGIYLYQSPRGLTDGDDTQAAMTQEKEDAELMLRNILAGIYTIPNASTVNRHPEVSPVTEITAQAPIVIR